jgi:hypothetical protein
MSMHAEVASKRTVETLPLPQPDFSSRDSYLAFCHKAVELFAQSGIALPATPTFANHLATVETGGEKVIKTPWGGVDIITRSDPHVEKFLVVKAGRFLAYEKHDEKVETLFGKEGYGVLVFRPEGEIQLVAEVVSPGYERTLKPGQEHCLIALSDLLVLEHSEDYKGMDKDLIFIHMPD